MGFLNGHEIAQFAASHPDLSLFGPDSSNPWLAVDLPECPKEVGPWLSQRPCPIIGIGSDDSDLASDCDVILETESALPLLTRNIEAAPLAAMILVQHLRASQGLNMDAALTAESFAYGTVQTGPEFRRWQDSAAKRAPLPEIDDPVGISVGQTIEITLNAPRSRNAIGVTMRDALCEAFDLALALDRPVYLTGTGRTFSVGGAIEEFGEVADPATAHWIRTLRLPANRLAHLSDRLEVHVNGAAIGAGVELAAFGQKVTATKSAWFQLPELKYGLIPGAGGTVSLPRRIGRHRTAYLALSMTRLRAEDALDWGLVDEII